jgi:hypothetical protein
MRPGYRRNCVDRDSLIQHSKPEELKGGIHHKDTEDRRQEFRSYRSQKAMAALREPNPELRTPNSAKTLACSEISPMFTIL